MAELILTDEEKAAETWLDLDDETIGKLVKHGALSVRANEIQKGREPALWWFTCAIVLCNLACDSNAGSMTQEITDLTYKGEHRGDWVVTVERKENER